MVKLIDTDKVSETLRAKCIRLTDKTLLGSDFHGTELADTAN